MAAVMGDVTIAATEGFVLRYADALGDENVATLRSAAEVIAAWQLARLTPFTAIHGDYRLDNLLFSPTDSGVVVVDWQTAALGPPMRDVAYFLGTSLGSEDRRAFEEQLVGDYHTALVNRGVTGYQADRCWEDYRLGQLQGPMVTVIGCMYATGTRTDKTDAMFLAMARRSCAAIRDLRSLEVL
jgi:aminoglycoside phosphotransferase (APT) family kinase protein